MQVCIKEYHIDAGHVSYLSVVTVGVVVALVAQVVGCVPVASVAPGVAGVVVTIVPGPAVHTRPLHPLLGRGRQDGLREHRHREPGGVRVRWSPDPDMIITFPRVMCKMSPIVINFLSKR